MLRVYAQYIDWLAGLRGVVAAIERRDVDLARQLRRAAASVALNLAEGSGSRGGVRTQRHLTALGSARETAACLDVAGALGYAVVPARVGAELQSVVRQLAALALGPR